MTRSLAVLAALLGVLALNSLAEAHLYSPPLTLAPGQWIACVIANVTTANLTVKMQVKDALGTIVSEVTTTMGPEDLATHGYSPPGAGGILHCKFVNATKAKARAAAQFWDGYYRYSVPAE